MIVKIVQLLKLSQANQATVRVMVELLNQNLVPETSPYFFASLYAVFAEKKVYPNNKEQYIINSLPNIYLAQNALMTYKLKESQGYLNAILALSMETAEFSMDFFNDYSLSLRGRGTQGVTAFKNHM